MYEPVADAWLRYLTLVDATVPADPGRSVRAAEIHTRFGQLDLILSGITTHLPAGSPYGDEAEHRRDLATWDWVAILTDSFYFFGWRLVDLLNGAGGDPFPRLAPVRPAGLLAVRHRSLDHPEWQSGYFRHAGELRDEAGVKIEQAIVALTAE
ncbi:hypothetical protein V6U90_20365 [Micromonospora sp. CPCC 206060]|uniref:hypothetical protein n=1 Tax=Micromonospora sp. CPCC 206060 TaxID=3122406 RepID=UPI002FEECCF2